MFISSMARKNKHLRSKSAGDVKKLSRREADLPPTKKSMSRSSVSSGVLVNGSKEGLRIKDTRYLSNTEKTIHPLRRSFDVPPNSTVAASGVELFYKNLNRPDIASSFSALENDMVERKLLQERLDDNNNLRHSLRYESNHSDEYGDWFVDPIHRRTRVDVSPNSSADKVRTKDIAGEKLRYDNYETKSDFYDSSLDSFRRAEANSIRHKLRAELDQGTPYELELCRLRYEKLKLEEAYLLKLKCEAELERTRGPKPKWYELKTRAFTTEMEKYTNLMKRKNNWQELLDYRNQLQEMTGEWSNLRH